MMRKQQLFPHQAYLERLLRQTSGPTKTPSVKKTAYYKTAEEHKNFFTASLAKYYHSRNPYDGPLFVHLLWEDMPVEINSIIDNYYEAICAEAMETKSHPYNVSRRVHYIHRQMDIMQLLKEIKPEPVDIVLPVLNAYINGLPKGTIRDGLQRVAVAIKGRHNVETTFNMLAQQGKYDGAIDAIRFHYNKAISELEIRG